MPGDPGLRGDDSVIAYRGAAGDADLGNHHTVAAENHIVTDLNLVVYFGALTDPRFPEAGTVNGGVRSDFDIIVNLHDTNLVDFPVASVDKFVAKPIGSQHHPGMEADPVAEHGVVIKSDPRMQEAVAANFGAFPDKTARSDFGAFADFDARFDDGARFDTDLGGIQHGGGIDHCGGVNAGMKDPGRREELFDDFRKGRRGVFDPHQGYSGNRFGKPGRDENR